MVSKRFHITPDGPKKCTASSRACPYASHYDSKESAFTAQRMLQMADSHEFKIAELKRIVQSRAPEDLMVTGFKLGGSGNTARRFANDLVEHSRQYDSTPKLYQYAAEASFDAGYGSNIKVTVFRDDVVDEDNAKFAGRYRVKIDEGRRYTNGMQDNLIELNFKDEQGIRRSFAQLRELYFNAARKSGARAEEDVLSPNDPNADAMADNALAEFKQVWETVEGQSRGQEELWEMGYGNFKNSDYDTIRVDVDYRKSGFSYLQLQNFLNSSDSYLGRTPDVEIRVVEDNPNLETRWELVRKNGEWKVYEENTQDTRLTYDIEDQQAAYDVVYWASMDSVNKNDADAAKERANFANDLVASVEMELDYHRDLVSERRAKLDREDEALKKGKINTDLFDRTKENKNSAMSKIFDLFT